MVEHTESGEYRGNRLFRLEHGSHCQWNLADNQAEVEEEDDAPAPKATKAKADKSKAKPAAKAEAAPPADDGA